MKLGLRRLSGSHKPKAFALEADATQATLDTLEATRAAESSPRFREALCKVLTGNANPAHVPTVVFHVDQRVTRLLDEYRAGAFA
jgi:hypothetical protein